MSSLKIYKSSAGSGKTFRLTASYLNLLLNDSVSHRNILAVTFTNKASGEMKSRIIETLYLISKGDQVASKIAAGILSGNEYDEKKIFTKASVILNTILNDYSAFQVGTIDRFFQWVIRSFARESGLQAGYNLELNNRRVLNEAIDLLLYSLDTDTKLREWLIQFAGDKVASGKDWNFIDDIFNLGSEIFKEQYQEITGGAKAAQEQKGKIEEYRIRLFQEVSIFENYLAGIGNEALRHIKEAGLSIDDFAYQTTGIAGYFLKISNKKEFNPKIRAREGSDQPEKWIKSDSNRKEYLLALVNAKLIPLLVKAIAYYDEKIVFYNTAQTILRNLFAFGILTDLYLKVRELAKEQNIFLLSDATIFLKKIIANNEAPFIYEKAGNYYSHFMLDEFQDTSRYQWENFHPLIINGLAGGKDSLIVGDVKQSIYRWRNSDWKILATEVQNEFPGFNVSIESLNTNWRSHISIVTFNNSLFSASPEVLIKKIEQDTGGVTFNLEFVNEWKDTIREIYQNSLQKISPKKLDTEGYVEVVFFNLKKKEYLEMLSERLPALIRDILSRGFSQGDIAILVRKGNQGRDIANILMKYSRENSDQGRFNIISNDSLFIENHSSVRFLIALLKYLKNPADVLNTAFIRHEFLSYLSDHKSGAVDKDGVFIGCENGIVPGLSKEFDEFSDGIDSLKRRPLFELNEELIRIFGLNNSIENIAFIQAFQDLVLDFVRNQTADISSFLSWWDMHGTSQTLTVSEAQDAIRIMTIHKSKGLQFPVVIIPFCDWNMDVEDVRTNYIWCRNYEAPFNYIENVPVNYGKGLSETYFQTDYLNEKFRNYVDNLNLLYVSLTRPEEELYILANLDKKDTPAQIIHKILLSGMEPQGYSDEFPEINLLPFFNEEENMLAIGKKGKPKKKTEKSMPEFLDQYPVSQSRDRLRLNVKNAWLMSNENDYSKKIGYGTVMHEILSEIETFQEIAPSVNKAILRGKIPATEFETIVSFLEKEISTPGIRKWFDGSWKLMREREVKTNDNKLQRPDRVMIKDDKVVVIDYKFGDNMIAGHKQQVLNYTQTIKNLGYKEVSGYLWYLSLNKIMEV